MEEILITEIYPEYVVIEFNSLKLPTEVQEDCEEKVNMKTDVIA